MRRILKLGFLASLSVMMFACSDDGPVDPTPGSKSEGKVVYLNVSINPTDAYASTAKFADADASSTATTTASSDYENGLEAEHIIDKARFFFYDKDGIFVCEAQIANGIGGNKPETDGDNVEYLGSTVLVLSGITQKPSDSSIPSQLVTVLNPPDGLTPGLTLEEMIKKTSGGYKPSDTSTHFIMTTSSYQPSTDSSKFIDNYFVTQIPYSKFKDSETEATSTDPVDIYVERLAAKVELAVSTKMEAVGENIYKLGDFTVVGKEGKQELCVKFLNWDVTCTTKDSYYMKNLRAFSDADLGFTWDLPERCRSLWGVSYNYDNSSFTYPEYYSKNAFNDDNKNTTLNYLNANQIKNAMALASDDPYKWPYDYCNENTNTATIVMENIPSCTTSAIVLAQLVDKNGNPFSGKLIRYNGLLYLEDDYIKSVLSNLRKTGAFKNYVESSTEAQSAAKRNPLLSNLRGVNRNDPSSGEEGGEDACELTADYLEVVRAPFLNGRIIVQVNTVDYPDIKEFAVDGRNISVDGINKILAAYNEIDPANGYYNSLMYYNIPIEHLNPKLTDMQAIIYKYQTSISEYKIALAEAQEDYDETQSSAAASRVAFFKLAIKDLNNKYAEEVAALQRNGEASYGVVRNHIYRITITQLTNIGYGIDDPEEPIIPCPDDALDYYISADFNVLPWNTYYFSVTF